MKNRYQGIVLQYQDLQENMEQEIIPFKSRVLLVSELNKKRNYSIVINGVPLDYSDNIHHEEDILLKDENTQTLFKQIRPVENPCIKNYPKFIISMKGRESCKNIRP
ncbi:hypothetical protein CS542_09005 [Pedobacter sp. IW39]|nr:hypothetical protein CS542_09005 [Pedobacter sp. IW39]